jgi:CheY-like chemotaxis protein
MTAILGFAELLQQEVLCCGHCSNHDDCQHRLAGREHVETIVSNGRYLLNIINDILDISKIEAGKLLTERIRFSLPSMLQEVQSLMQVRSSAKGLDLRFEVDGKLPRFIENDPTRLKQVLLNLIGNAIKFTEAGSVRVIIRFNRRPLLEKDAASHGEIVFEIIDTGIGIGPEQLQNLFQPFNQADSSTTRRYGGTGLGLSISKRLATMLGGDIVVESRPGEGSVFTLSIDAGTAELGDWVTDLSADQDESKPVASPDETKRTNKPLDCRILLAEDGIDNQRLIKFILTKAGADVTIAENGKEAVNEVQRAAHENRRFDLVLMDMQMPVMDGYEATRHLRELGYAGTIVALTAHAMATDRDRCIDAGCDDFATKPIDRNALVSLVRGIVAKPVDSVL